MISTTKKKRQAQEQEKRRQRKIEKRKGKSSEPGHRSWPTHNQKAVAKRLLAGEINMVGGTGWSFVEPFLAFLGEPDRWAMVYAQDDGGESANSDL